jgi:NitT/TauT family transport system substrate-binding protein
MTTCSRREFFGGVTAFGLTEMLAGRPVWADEGPPETTTIRLAKSSSLCLAPIFVAEDLLRAEGFKDIQYVSAAGGFEFPKLVAGGDVDFAGTFAASIVYRPAHNCLRRSPRRLLRAVRP